MYCKSVKPRTIAIVKPVIDEHFMHIKYSAIDRMNRTEYVSAINTYNSTEEEN